MKPLPFKPRVLSVAQQAAVRAAPVVTAEEVKHMQKLVRRLHDDPSAAKDILETERDFLKQMVEHMVDMGTVIPPKFARIATQAGLL